MWNPLFPLNALALMLLSRQGASLAHLDALSPYDVVIWTDSSVPFSFGKGSSGVLVNCSLYVTQATLSFSEGPVCSSFSAEACAILQALFWFWQQQQIGIPALFSSYLTLGLSLPPCFLLHLYFHPNLSGRNCFLSPPVLSGYNGSPDTRYSGGTAQLMSWPHEERYSPLCNPLWSLSFYLSYSLFFFLEWKRTVSEESL